MKGNNDDEQNRLEENDKKVKKKHDAGNYTKNADPKKRKLEEDLETAPPSKLSKSDQEGTSGRRPAEVHLEEPVRVNNPKKRLRLTDLF